MSLSPRCATTSNSISKSPGLELRHAKDLKTLDYDESKFEKLGCMLGCDCQVLPRPVLCSLCPGQVSVWEYTCPACRFYSHCREP